MRKLPRRLPSNSPSLAWVGFAVLLLAVGGGLAGLYTHRQNQEAAKLRQIAELRDELTAWSEKTIALEEAFRVRKAAAQLKLAVHDRKLNLIPITPAHRVLINVDTTPVAAESPASAAPAASGSVMAVVGRP
jgi:hypothetical protein